jgi:hypothetical protein
MQFKVIASVLFFVAQIMATPTADNPSKSTLWVTGGAGNCALSFMVLR